MPIVTHLFTEDIKRPALVLVHGLGSAGNIWKSLIPKLTPHFSVIAVDLPGHGIADLHEHEDVDPKSLAHAIVEEVSTRLNVDHMHVAGNSLGGWIALEMGAIAPDKVKTVTALAPAGLWHQVPTSKLPPSFFDARILAKISQHFMRLAYHLPPLKAIGYKKITHLWRELSYESCRDSVLAMANSKGYMPLWRGLRGRKFESSIPKEVKVSIVFGDYDLTLPEEIAQEKSVAPEHSNWVVVDNCAHVIMWNYPDLTVDFIKKTALAIR
ncbi:MhpC Predicted hydrolases or acyltransferases (alpha/beta hydrolase superfamily) [Candidatus Nanopelagicaceae bacterium]